MITLSPTKFFDSSECWASFRVSFFFKMITQFRRIIKCYFLVGAPAFSQVVAEYPAVNPWSPPFYTGVPAVRKNGILDFTRLHHATLYLSRSAKNPNKIVGRISGCRGTVPNASKKKQIYKRANVGSSLFDLEVRFNRSIYTVYKRDAVNLWAIVIHVPKEST